MKLIIILTLFAVMFATVLIIFSPFILGILHTEDNITAHAQTTGKEFKWTKQVVNNGVTIDAEYLWPEEENPLLTAIYRDGVALAEENMVTITQGSIYHFWGISDNAVLYAQVYTESGSSVKSMASDETGTWYQLLPSSVRKDFENSGWTWKTTDYDITYLDPENQCIVIGNDNPAAVLYGIGLFMDYKYNYSANPAFGQEGSVFNSTFGNTDNLFAKSLEYYYTRGGELENACPVIYAVVKEILSQ